jgi:putative transposase
MDGKRRFRNNIFVERDRRILKYECLYLNARETRSKAKAGVGKWMAFYNRKRPYSALSAPPPAVVYWLRYDAYKPHQQAQ